MVRVPTSASRGHFEYRMRADPSMGSRLIIHLSVSWDGGHGERGGRWGVGSLRSKFVRREAK